MKTLFHDLKRLVPGMRTGNLSWSPLAARSKLASRRPRRARLDLESLETRNLLSGVAPPGPPPTLTATATSPTSVNLWWSMPPNVYNPADYVVDMEDPETPGVWQQVNELTNVGNTVSSGVGGLSADTTYWFKVAEGENSGDPNSYWSTPESATTLPLVMTPPAVTVTASQTTITLSWNSEAGASGYNIYEGANAPVLLTSVSSGKTSYSIGGLSAGTTYDFGVGAFNPGSMSLPQMQAATTPPVAPTVSLKAVSPTTIDVTWSSVAGATGYQVNWSNNFGSSQGIKLSGSTTLYALTNLTPGTTCRIQVAAYDSGGSSWSALESMLTLPAAPSTSLTTLSSTQIDVTWNAEVGVSTYEVEEAWVGGWMGVASVRGSSTGCVINSLTPGNNYLFDVVASNATGQTWGYAQSAYTTPTAPSLTATPVSASQVNLSWGSVSGASNYVIKWWNSITQVWATSVASSATTYSVTGLNPDTSYTFEILADDPGGDSTPTTASALTFPAAPSFSFSGVYASQVNISWGYVSGATGYAIDELVNNTWKQIANISQPATSAPVTSFEVTGLSSGSTYYFEVAAYNASGASWANDQGVTTVSIPRNRPVPAAAPASSLQSDVVAEALASFSLRGTAN